jgi:hypothetical protein
MKEKTSRGRGQKARIKKSSRAKVAARDPAPGSKNRPGFDLGGAVGDAKPDAKNRSQKSKTQSRAAVKKRGKKRAS